MNASDHLIAAVIPVHVLQAVHFILSKCVWQLKQKPLEGGVVCELTYHTTATIHARLKTCPKCVQSGHRVHHILSLRCWSLELKALNTLMFARNAVNHDKSRQREMRSQLCFSQLSVIHTHAFVKPHVISRLKFEEGGRDQRTKQCRADLKRRSLRTDQDHCTPWMQRRMQLCRCIQSTTTTT